jgi:ABC-type Fe3+/spermidine/putrescine transport system ATPase subunit
VALARAVVTEPRLLLLDEPLGALDQNLREEMQTELRKLQSKLGLTTVLVTHDQHEAVVLADRVAVMRAGRIEQVGAPLDIYDRPRTPYVAAFTGVENMLPAHGGGGSVAIAGVPIPGLATPASGSVIVAARASSIVLRPSGNSPGSLTGTVNFVQVLGSAIRYEIALAEGPTVIAEEPRRNGIDIAVGATVDVALPPDRCTVFDAEKV